MLLGIISLLIGQFFGNSLVPIGTKITSPLIGPILFVFFRFLIATLLLFIIFLFSKKRKIGRRDYKNFILIGFLLFINVSLFTIAIPFTTVIMSTLIYSLTPIFVGVGAHFFLDERITKRNILGLLISFAGLLFLISESFTGHQINSFGKPFGNILIFIAMIGYSYYVFLSRKVLNEKNHLPVQTTFITFSFSTLFLFVVLCTELLFGEITLSHPLPPIGVIGFFLVGIGSVAQYLALQIGVKRTSAFTASLFQYTGPFIAAAITIPLLHEQVTIQLFIGGFLILAGVFIATTYGQFKKKVSKTIATN
jgi:drug/metabolite transporter (DMT)-like permease